MKVIVLRKRQVNAQAQLVITVVQKVQFVALIRLHTCNRCTVLMVVHQHDVGRL